MFEETYCAQPENEDINENALTTWITEHKKALIITGGILTDAILTALLIRNRSAISGMLGTITRSAARSRFTPTTTVQPRKLSHIDLPAPEIPVMNSIPITRAPHNVGEHIRNLPNGWSASESKIMEAIKRGYELAPGQTLVDPYRTGINAA